MAIKWLLAACGIHMAKRIPLAYHLEKGANQSVIRAQNIARISSDAPANALCQFPLIAATAVSVAHTVLAMPRILLAVRWHLALWRFTWLLICCTGTITAAYSFLCGFRSTMPHTISVSRSNAVS